MSKPSWKALLSGVLLLVAASSVTAKFSAIPEAEAREKLPDIFVAAKNCSPTSPRTSLRLSIVGAMHGVVETPGGGGESVTANVRTTVKDPYKYPGHFKDLVLDYRLRWEGNPDGGEKVTSRVSRNDTDMQSLRTFGYLNSDFFGDNYTLTVKVSGKKNVDGDWQRFQCAINHTWSYGD